MACVIISQYILTDNGGIDLSYFCRNDTYCRSTVSRVKYGHAYKSVSRPLTQKIISKMYDYFDHMAEGALWGGCEYLLHLEEDVWHNRPLTVEERPPADAGGGNNNKTNDRYIYMCKFVHHSNLVSLNYVYQIYQKVTAIYDSDKW